MMAMTTRSSINVKAPIRADEAAPGMVLLLPVIILKLARLWLSDNPALGGVGTHFGVWPLGVRFELGEIGEGSRMGA